MHYQNALVGAAVQVSIRFSVSYGLNRSLLNVAYRARLSNVSNRTRIDRMRQRRRAEYCIKDRSLLTQP